MHRVVPELIVENFRAGRYSGEFRAVGMFMDLSGFSTMTDTLMQHGQHGAEVLAGLMHSVFDPLVESIFEYGGKIVGFAGDGIMALYPVESDERAIALRALASAAVIQQRLAENPARVTVYGSFPITARIGLTLGSVSWQILRANENDQATYYFRGTAVDGSAAAEHNAPAGCIFMTGELDALLCADIETEPSGSFHRFIRFCIEEPSPSPTVFPSLDLEVARRFMPEDVIIHDVRGEFRQVVNLFMRFPDLSDDVLRRFMDDVFELRRKYGGLLTRLDFGDKGCNMLMLWGAPVAYENDIGRALNFILDLQARAGFPITAGVTYYIAHAGYLGSAMCEDYTCYGWGVNLASRFMMNAPESAVWIDERIARRVKNRFEYEYRGSQFFKGFASEQKVYSLLRRKLQEVFHQGELVGREAELARLVDHVEPLWRGKFAGLTVIWGEAGIGKSRLVYELKSEHEREGRRVLWALCHSDQILRHSFNPFRYWLFRYFDIHSGTDDREQKWAFDSKLDTLIGQTQDPELAGELDRLRTVLGSLLDLYWEDSFYENLDAEGRYNNTLSALIALIKAESLRQPVIIFIEDAQFLDVDSRAFLPRLKRALSLGMVEYPVAIVTSSRHVGATGFLPEELLDNSIVLGALSTQALATLSEIYLGGNASSDLVQLLEARSEGNPYFAEQILIYLLEEKLLEMSDRGWRVARGLQETSLPADIRALLIARLDQLTRNVREVIQTAAVLGREFEVRVLAEMLSGDESLEEEIAEAEKAEIWSALSQIRYIFTHGLLRDAAYSMQMRARRMELHAIALSALETIHGEDIQNHYGELAYHAEHARLTDKALDYLQKAGRSSSASYQNSQALDYFTRAQAFISQDDLAALYDLTVERVEMFSRMGRREQQLAELNTLDEWARQLQDSDRIAKALMLRSAYLFFIGNYPDSIQCAQQAEAIPNSLAAAELALYTRVVHASCLLHLGRLEEAMDHALATLERDRRAENRWEEARILNTLGLIALEQGKAGPANGYFQDALAIAVEIKDPGLESRALNQLAKLEGEVNRNFVFAGDYFERSYKLAHAIGDRFMEGGALFNMGFAAAMSGEFETAEAHYEKALLIAREIGDVLQETYVHINLSANAGYRRQAETAWSEAQKAIELARTVSERSSEAWGWLYLGHAGLMLGRFEQARDAYERSVALRLELNQTNLGMEPTAGLVELHLALGDIPAAAREAEKIVQHIDSGLVFNGADEPLRIYHACYILLDATKDPRASRILQIAKRALEAQVSSFNDESARNRYAESIPWRRAIRDTILPSAH